MRGSQCGMWEMVCVGVKGGMRSTRVAAMYCTHMMALSKHAANVTVNAATARLTGTQ